MKTLRALILALLGVAVAALGWQPAAALPPGGPGPNTPGTSSAISPRSVAPGGLIRFTVRGFPGGETLYVKIDDGRSCSNSSHGACVYHTQRIPKSGVVSGSFYLPKNIKQGSHWLRFLAAAYVDPKNPGKGTKGYTRRSPNFTVTGGSSSSKGGSNTTTTTTTTTSGGGTPGGKTTSKGTVAKPKAGKKAGQPTKVPAAPATEGGSLDAALNGKVSATLTDGGAVLGVGEDFAGEWAFVYAYSEPTPLGWHQVSANGTVTVPTADLAGGDHRLAVLDADGKLLGWNQVTLTGEAVPAPAAPAPQVAPAADAGPGVGVWALGGAVLLVGAGLVVVLLRRRRTA